MTSAPETFLALAGLAQVAIGVGHVALPKQLSWRTDLAHSSEMTRRVSYVHAFFIGLTCTMFGVLTVGFRRELMSGQRLSQAVAVGIAAFWACRFVVQIVVFTEVMWTTALYKLAHIVALLGWVAITAVYIVAALA